VGWQRVGAEKLLLGMWYRCSQGQTCAVQM
jgi:hypothetical protein